MKILKKIGSVLFCLLPVLLAFGIQLAVSFAGILLLIALAVLPDPAILSDAERLIRVVSSAIDDSQFFTLLSAIYAVTAALALGFWYWWGFVRKNRPHRKASSLLNLRMLAGLILLAFGLQYLSNYLVALLAAVNPAWLDSYEKLMESAGFGEVTPLIVLYGVIIAPISEELIFRGVTMRYALKAMPFFLANLFQAFLFGLFHGNMIQGTYAFVAGLFLGYVCYAGGSLFLSILFHLLFNLLGTFLPEAFFYAEDSIPLHLLILVASAGVTAAGLFLYRTGAKAQRQTAS